MGVMACDRRGCRHVMCDRLILEGTAYLCDECWKELLLAKAGWCFSTVADVRACIESFLKTTPGTFLVDPADIEEEFRRLTE